MAPPLKLAHVVFRTGQLEAMKSWYSTVLEAQVVFDSSYLVFLTFDEEHHRVALVDVGETDEAPPAGRGLEHVAFTYASLEVLLENYERLKALGILPYWTINHGPTTSMYYRDPDGNQLELQVENFATREALNAWFRSGAIRRNPIGVNFDPEDLIARIRAGEPAAALLSPDW